MKIHLKLTLFKIIKNKERHIIENKKILFTEKQRLKKKKNRKWVKEQCKISKFAYLYNLNEI